ncbi:hypothetical protein G4B88_022605 [Cannabis sativa]|uniref:Phospholipase/carboxylesterase/thioesterase domain-containing protein n=2 Tax=Cannabis sativa TaxID=3483 RepID=A0A7J6HW86_CANSA|nr:hypothetical protein G4B88_022605 [Cannabis sativa]
MKLVLLTKPITLLTLTLSGTLLFTLVFRPNPSIRRPDSMARSFILWLHGLGDSGPANQPIKNLFTSPEFRNTNWSFPSAPSNPVTCNYGAVMPSWFDIHEIPVTADSPKDESSLNVHKMIDKEIAAGTNPNNIFVCGFSQGGALTLASVLLYPKTLGGGAVFSGWVPFNSSLINQISPDAKRTPILWSHGMDDRTVLFEAGQAGPPFLEKAGIVASLSLRVLLTVTLSTTVLFTLVLRPGPSFRRPVFMARSFILWLHGRGDSGPANEPIKNLFTSPEFRNTVWSFPSAPPNPVTFYNGAISPSWFDIHEVPITADSPKDEISLVKAVENVHKMIDKEIAAGTNPNNIFVCGFSQGGALTLASVLLYPKTLGGGAVISGWVPFNPSLIDQISPDAKRTPILWLHGMDDERVLFKAGLAGPPLLENAGISCEFKPYPGLTHTIISEEFEYLESWIKTRLQCSS